MTWPRFVLALLITAYGVYFSAYTIHRHNTLNSYAADLSLIAQPMWNTVKGPGGFMEQTWGHRQQPRLAEHVEPILIPLAGLFYLWDDVRVLLIVQSVTLAVGAIPIFWIARHQLKQCPLPRDSIEWGAVTFAAVYLLSPHIQAANIADFHADPFVVTPLLMAFWFALREKWRWLWVWAVIAMLTKETLPTLTAMLGLWLFVQMWFANSRVGMAHALALMGVSATWFYIATFVIVAPLAAQHFGTDGPIYLANRFDTLSLDAARWQYLAGLLLSMGLLPLLAPQMLILGLPVLVANVLSNFPGQYSGEQHYSAPVVVALVIATIYGIRRIVQMTPRRAAVTLHILLLWLLAWSLGYHALHGWTPLSTRMEIYEHTPASQRLPHLLSQLPAKAIVSASAGIHPHVAQRQTVYVYPTVEDATHLLIDVTDIPGVHPNDAYAKTLDLLQSGWTLLAADHGLILAQRAADRPSPPGCSATLPFPCPFYDFAHAMPHFENSRLYPGLAHRATMPTQVTFGDSSFALLAYALHDDPDDGITFRFYWRVAQPTDIKLFPLIYTGAGDLLNHPTLAPMPATVWYPPAGWSTQHIIVTETLPQRLPDSFHLGMAVGPTFEARLPVTSESSNVRPGNWVQLATYQRHGQCLYQLPTTPSLQSFTPTNATFGTDLTLTGYRLESRHPVGGTLPLTLRWTTSQRLPADFTVFVHLTDTDGQRIAQSDAYPTWLFPVPTSQWMPGQTTLDFHTLDIPADVMPGSYQLLMGVYNAQTLERLPRRGGNGDTFHLSTIELQ